MHFLKKRWPIIIAAGIIIIGVFAWKSPFTQASPLSKEEMETQLVAMYDGDVEDLTLRSDRYEAKLIKDGAEYAVQADAASGKVLSLEQTKESPPEKPLAQDNESDPEIEENPPAVEETSRPEEDASTEKEAPDFEDPAQEDNEDKTDENDSRDKKEEEETEKQEEQEPEEEPTTLISTEEAASIALDAIPEGMIGEIDELDYIETNEGGYYLVEVDIDTEDDMDEVVYEIHAISGEVLTTKWDD